MFLPIRRVLCSIAAAFALVVLGWTALPAMPASASGPTVTGAGSTWVQIALDQWRSDVARQGLSINYQGVGSTAGRQFFIINQVDFAATEIPFLKDELAQLKGEHKSFQYLPDVAGGTALMYNLHDAGGARIKNLQLSARTIEGIFSGRITNWNDPAITADNGGHALGSQTIIPVIRSDGSGTSAKLADYLAFEDPTDWAQFASQYGLPHDEPVQFWPSFPGSVSQRGSDGVANFVANDSVGRGAIGYVEAGYAFGRGFPVVSLRNKSGHYAQPTSANDAVALTHATLNPDLTQNLTGVYNAPEANAYPLASYSYLVTQTSGFDPAKGEVLGKFIIYIACAGQQEAAPLGYSPMPKNLVLADFDAIKRIPGAPAPPPVDYEHCPNPNLKPGGGGGGGGGTTPPPGGHTTPPPSSGGNQGSGQNGGGQTSASGQPTGSSGATQPPPGTVPGADPAAGAALGVHLLTAPERAAHHRAGVQAANYAQSNPTLPLTIAALGVVLLTFFPLLFQRRRTRAGDVAGPPKRVGESGPSDDADA
jgi:phosphate transport system substrate-binding protein